MSNGQCILIIDDEEDLARLMETVLHKEGIPNIITAGTIADGWAKFQEFNPALVLLDIIFQMVKDMIYASKFVKCPMFRFYFCPQRMRKLISF